MKFTENEIKKVIISIVDKYGGYVKEEIILPEMAEDFSNQRRNDLTKQVFDYIISQNKKLTYFKEEMVLPILHYRAINFSSEETIFKIPENVKETLKEDTFQRIKMIARAAARCYKILTNDIIGKSEIMQKVKREVWYACFGENLFSALIYQEFIKKHNVLIIGETGTGKELIADAIQNSVFWHDYKKKWISKPKINVTAFSRDLLASELFGHEKGAFTGAINKRVGLLESANGFSIFLDEVGDMHRDMQAQLLRVIENEEIRPTGSNEFIPVKLRYIAATNKDVSNPDIFRPDLFERLAGIIIKLPPLRDRREDILPIRDAFIEGKVSSDYNRHFIKRARGKIRIAQSKLDERFQDEKYYWPGNIRQLQSAARSAILGLDIESNIKREKYFKTDPDIDNTNLVPQEIMDCEYSVDKLKKWYLNRVMKKTKGNKSEAAKILDVNTATIDSWIKKYDI